MEGDGVRHNRADLFIGSDDSWLPRGARSFLLALVAETLLPALSSPSGRNSPHEVTR